MGCSCAWLKRVGHNRCDDFMLVLDPADWECRLWWLLPDFQRQCGVSSPQACADLDAGQLAELASQAKHQAKDLSGYSLYLIDTAPVVQASSFSG